jgi:curved DNA-binding protein CbpA
LKYHPDRNPGREQEVNSQFQIIQAAHEILSDPDAKSRYDASFARSAASRYPASSGVRGNPWQNVGQQFPVPPRRNPPRTTTSGAQRWNERFSAGVPPTAKQQTSPATAARAFESMRKGGAKSGQQERPVPPPPPPPRTEGAKKRAEASFGAKKAGYYPRSSTPGDEPPVTNNNYSSRFNTERSDPVPDPLAQFRQKSHSEEDFMDTQQNSPYTKGGGEKANPFDSNPLNRAKSAKEPSRQEEPSEPASPPTPKRRSSSMPRKETKGGAQRSQNETEAGERHQAVPVPPSSRPSFKAPSEPAAAAPNGSAFTTNQTFNTSAANESTPSSSSHIRE